MSTQSCLFQENNCSAATALCKKVALLIMRVCVYVCVCMCLCVMASMEA